MRMASFLPLCDAVENGHGGRLYFINSEMGDESLA